MVLLSYEAFSIGTDLIFMIFVGILALFCLVAPYDLIKKVFPKVSSQKVIRIAAAIVLLLMIAGVTVSILL